MAGTTSSAADLIPERPSLDALRDRAAGCQACELWRTGTQTVFGEGPDRARVMLVGEQPGDREDLAGRPFVGPAGRLLDEALDAAGIDRDTVYVTNVVKHFKWTAKGKRRIHKRPNAEEVAACRPWLHAEIALVRPEVVVCLGATAAQALLGPAFRVTRERGRFLALPPAAAGALDAAAPLATATVHPSSILRAADEGTRQAELRAFVDDLAAVAARLGAPSGPA